MAQGRMLKGRITKSKKMAALRTDKARLLWFYMLPFTDCEGRIEADPEDIKDEILRKQRRGYTVERIEQCLQDLHRVGLIVLYQTNGRRYLEYTRFHDENKIRRDREAESEIPAPDTGEVQELGGSSPAISKVKLSKIKLKEYTDEFEKFWKRWKGRWNPEKSKYIKVGKHNAFLVWEKLTIDDQRQAWWAADKVSGKYVPDAERWLRDRKFDDYEKRKR